MRAQALSPETFSSGPERVDNLRHAPITLAALRWLKPRSSLRYSAAARLAEGVTTFLRQRP